MNPWEIVSWVGALAVTTLIIIVTTIVIRAALRAPKSSGSTRIYNSKKHD